MLKGYDNNNESMAENLFEDEISDAGDNDLVGSASDGREPHTEGMLPWTRPTHPPLVPILAKRDPKVSNTEISVLTRNLRARQSQNSPWIALPSDNEAADSRQKGDPVHLRFSPSHHHRRLSTFDFSDAKGRKVKALFVDLQG